MDVTPTIRAALTRVSPQRLNELREMPYADYLRTVEWRKRRDLAIRAASFQCGRCASKRDIQVHHTFYGRLGEELATDLEVLCRACHEGHHFDESRRQHIGIYVKLASEALKAGARTVPDLTAGIRDRCRELSIEPLPRSISRAIDVVLERMPTTLPRKTAVIEYRDAPAISKTEAAAIVRALGLLVPFKEMPRLDRNSRIDIYAPVPREDYGDHDRY